MAETPGPPLESLRSIAESNVQRILFAAFIYPVLQFLGKTSELIGALFDVIIVPTTSFIDGFGQFILALVVGGADVIGAGSGAATEAFLTGVWGALGPFAYPASIGAVLAGIYLLLQYLEMPFTSDSILGLFTGTDLPIIGTDEDEE
ncbi:hypothetical protein [Haloplanus salinarum]|uniref:hypothetical protein n=1 Tax=Haloplanus salinarum TaxID=1912324 RepID=UPI00214CDD9B|nr:hypothetical protein [Haloplanus salinarum]